MNEHHDDPYKLVREYKAKLQRLEFSIQMKREEIKDLSSTVIRLNKILQTRKHLEEELEALRAENKILHNKFDVIYNKVIYQAQQIDEPERKDNDAKSGACWGDEPDYK